jgi:hypothetical protein
MEGKVASRRYKVFNLTFLPSRRGLAAAGTKYSK